MDSYEYERNRRTRHLDASNAPEKATHIATCPQGFKWFVFYEDGYWWIAPSDDYGTGYGYASLFLKDVSLEKLPAKENA